MPSLIAASLGCRAELIDCMVGTLGRWRRRNISHLADFAGKGGWSGDRAASGLVAAPRREGKRARALWKDFAIMSRRGETQGPVPTGVVTFLMTDVEDSTRLWEAAPEAMASAIDRHYELLGEAIGRHGGAQPIEQGEGDSVVGAFAHASDALAAALEAQLALRAERWPTGAELRVRMALHSGEARLRDASNYIGSAIIRCARLRGLCPGGQITVSAATREVVRDALPAGTTLVDLGERPLKGIGRPERVYALFHPEFDGHWELPSPAGNLPPELTRFVGREREVAEISGALRGARLLTLTGPGGAGKTRLALRVAAERAGSFPDGQWWLGLAPVRDGDSVVEALAGVLGVRPSPGRGLVQAVIGRLAEDHALVVLDNCEHLIEAAADLAEALLRGCPHVVVLATSREPLGVPGESDWPVPPLSLPLHAGLEPPAVVARSDAGALFVERASKALPSFELTDGNAPPVARICRELDGIPLAIELAAARVRMLSVEQIASQLGNRLRLLTGGPRGADPRQRTLRGSVDWSYDLLSEQERLLFRRLAVFIGGWSLDAVRAVCTGNGLEDGAILDVLGSLVDKSLVRAEQHERIMRYRMLETVRQYAVELCEDAGEAPRLRERHLEFFLLLAERAASELEIPRNLEWLEVLEPEAANHRAAIDHGVATDPERALRIGVALTAWWEVSGRFSAAESALERALAAADPSPSQLRARALWTRGHFARYLQADTVADELFEQALELAESTGDESTQARALRAKGFWRALRDPVGGRPDLARAFDLAQSAGDAWALLSAAASLAWSYAWTDEFTETERVCDEAQQAMDRLGVRSGAWAPLALAYHALVRADHERCAELCQQAVATARELGDPVNEGFAHAFMAWDEMAQGRADAALARTLRAEARLTAIGGFSVPTLRQQQAKAHAALGNLDRAQELLELVLAGAREDYQVRLWALLALGDVLRVLGDAERAKARAGEALELSERLGARSHVAAARELLGRLAVGRGEWSEADRLAHEALAQRAEIGALMYLPQTLDLLAQVAAGLESHTEAVRLLGAAERARSDLGVVRWPPDGRAFEELEQLLQDRLGSEPYAAAQTEGAAMSLDEAIGWVRRARGSRKRPTGGWEALTPTELQVVGLISAGLTNPQIAARMFISRATVKAHLTHIFQKLDVRSRAELAALAARRAGPI
jgi:predicted ATPase/class 3 adenylate cyclase/DNA-binding CsgD family transcriptional regulator